MGDSIRVVKPPRAARKTSAAPWHEYLTIDVVYSAWNRTLGHPFVAWMVPLCFRTVMIPYENISMILAMAYASLLTLLWIASVFNKRIAFGIPREVNLDEEVVVITGGASGLGRLIADFYAMKGANVAVLDVKRDEDDEMMGIEYHHCDVSNFEQVEASVAEIRENLGVPTILINNAGVMHNTSILDTTPSEIDLTFSVNLKSHWYTVKACVPGMLEEERGTIVTIASVLGHLGCSNLSTYTASKAGLLSFHQSLVAELASTPEIKTVLVAPGQLDTPMFKGLKTPSNFLAPVVAPVELARHIVETIDSGWSGEVYLPLYTRTTALIPALPASLQKIVKLLSGMDRAAATFAEKSKKAL